MVVVVLTLVVLVLCLLRRLEVDVRNQLAWTWTFDTSSLLAQGVSFSDELERTVPLLTSILGTRRTNK